VENFTRWRGRPWRQDSIRCHSINGITGWVDPGLSNVNAGPAASPTFANLSMAAVPFDDPYKNPRTTIKNTYNNLQEAGFPGLSSPKRNLLLFTNQTRQTRIISFNPQSTTVAPSAARGMR